MARGRDSCAIACRRFGQNQSEPERDADAREREAEGVSFGAIHRAVQIARDEDRDVAHIHVRYLSPFPRNLGELLKRYDRVLVPEMNNGQLVKLLRAEYLIPAEGFSKVTGKPFRVTDIVQRIRGGAPPPSEGSGLGGEAG